jgi:predicted ribosome quality control (RQC) complex YloA/Tae2 family protein
MWADTLLSYPQQHERDRTTITLVGPNGDDISIPLNPAHSIIENATRLYDKARSAETAALHREQRIPELQRKINELEERIAKIEQADTIRDIEASSPQRMNTQTHDPRDEAGGRFRVFFIDEQHTLYVGKSAANNDELTMRFAKQNDWWLHARGSAGSHAVLRGVDADRIPKPVLEKAAAITAYYSQARNASWVSVVYTQRKNVRKPKGANVGAVVLEREQTVMVKPSIPS